MNGNSDPSQALDSGEAAGDALRVSSDALLDPLVLFEAVRDAAGQVVDFVYRELNQATCDYLGLNREELRDHGLLETTPGVAGAGLFDDYVRCLETGEPLIYDDFTYDNEILADTRHYDFRVTRASPTSITMTWRDVTDRVKTAQLLAEAREFQHKADARYRRLMENSGIGMALCAPDGRFEAVNPAICAFFGYDADELCTKTWQELTAPDYLDVDLKNAEDVLAGEIDSYRMEKQYLHADGTLVWGDLSVSCLRTPEVRVESFVVQITDITSEVTMRRQLALSDEQNRLLALRLRAEAERTAAELHSAADYVSSILPDDLDGPVRASSVYLPAQELAGDIFDFGWIDDDHFMVYLIDTSGHGIGPALLAVSVHNLLRSGSLQSATTLNPDEMLSELNLLFQMDRHDNRFLPMWLGIYERASRTLRYASAGSPPAIVVDSTVLSEANELSSGGVPLGMFEDSAYFARSYGVPHGCRILLYSDGAYEQGQIGGQQMSVADFRALAAQHAGASLDDLVTALRDLTPAGTFDDDCSVIQLEFD